MGRRHSGVQRYLQPPGVVLYRFRGDCERQWCLCHCTSGRSSGVQGAGMSRRNRGLHKPHSSVGRVAANNTRPSAISSNNPRPTQATNHLSSASGGSSSLSLKREAEEDSDLLSPRKRKAYDLERRIWREETNKLVAEGKIEALREAKKIFLEVEGERVDGSQSDDEVTMVSPGSGSGGASLSSVRR
ncbi:hypothetical protein BKA93DRAFT_477161 [Sparassis latifolia]